MSDLIHILSEFLGDFPNMFCPDISDNNKKAVIEALEEAIILIRTHALDPKHPLAID